MMRWFYPQSSLKKSEKKKQQQKQGYSCFEKQFWSVL